MKDRWIVTFADLLTLLLCFVLWTAAAGEAKDKTNQLKSQNIINKAREQSEKSSGTKLAKSNLSVGLDKIIRKVSALSRRDPLGERVVLEVKRVKYNQVNSSKEIESILAKLKRTKRVFKDWKLNLRSITVSGCSSFVSKRLFFLAEKVSQVVKVPSKVEVRSGSCSEVIFKCEV
ncbi:MAG: hypothetical protein D6780_01310 [Candidatus Dadabacteria bacterium]|nr:MAG: hypothetical protein D6780_01310 [Candidatus Dadabacteria bacterium]